MDFDILEYILESGKLLVWEHNILAIKLKRNRKDEFGCV